MSHSTSRALALGAFESALRHAPREGLSDLHEALQTGQLAVQGWGKADLVRGSWGTLGNSNPAERYSACPLNALYARRAAQRGRGLGFAVRLLEIRMARDGYRPEDFYLAWDRGHFTPAELRGRVERHMEARMEPAVAE